MHPSVPIRGNALFLSSITPLLPATPVVIAAPATPVSEVPAYPGYPSCPSRPSRPSCLRYKKNSRDTLRYHGSTLLYTFVIL